MIGAVVEGLLIQLKLMLRLLVLQQMVNLSDDALAYQVLDRASFQRFVGL